MQHMVIFRSSEGRPSYHQAEDLESAVKFVEHLRNEEQVAEAGIFQMQEVPIEVKTYYRVEVATVAPAPQAAPLGGVKIDAQKATAAAAVPAVPAVSVPPVPPSAPVPPSPDDAVPVAVGSGAEGSVATPITPPTPVAGARFGLFSRG